MGQYNREVINAYREAKCLQCFTQETETVERKRNADN